MLRLKNIYLNWEFSSGSSCVSLCTTNGGVCGTAINHATKNTAYYCPSYGECYFCSSGYHLYNSQCVYGPSASVSYDREVGSNYAYSITVSGSKGYEGYDLVNIGYCVGTSPSLGSCGSISGTGDTRTTEPGGFDNDGNDYIQGYVRDSVGNEAYSGITSVAECPTGEVWDGSSCVVPCSDYADASCVSDFEITNQDQVIGDSGYCANNKVCYCDDSFEWDGSACIKLCAAGSCSNCGEIDCKTTYGCDWYDDACHETTSECLVGCNPFVASCVGGGSACCPVGDSLLLMDLEYY